MFSIGRRFILNSMKIIYGTCFNEFEPKKTKKKILEISILLEVSSLTYTHTPYTRTRDPWNTNQRYTIETEQISNRWRRAQKRKKEIYEIEQDFKQNNIWLGHTIERNMCNMERKVDTDRMVEKRGGGGSVANWVSWGRRKPAYTYIQPHGFIIYWKQIENMTKGTNKRNRPNEKWIFVVWVFCFIHSLICNNLIKSQFSTVLEFFVSVGLTWNWKINNNHSSNKS